jgi:hypothetical protein
MVSPTVREGSAGHAQKQSECNYEGDELSHLYPPFRMTVSRFVGGYLIQDGFTPVNSFCHIRPCDATLVRHHDRAASKS